MFDKDKDQESLSSAMYASLYLHKNTVQHTYQGLVCNRIVILGRIPFIKPKKNTCRNARGSKAWKQMVSLYMDSKDEFNKHYHKRSLVESVFNVIKGVFGNNLNARKRRMQRKELMLRIICYNIGIVNLQEIKNSMAE